MTASEPRVSFVGIGPGRSGTSWVHRLLQAHPEICMGSVKEVEFFNTHFLRGIDWYESHFSSCSRQQIAGEISNNYYLDEGTLQRIKKYNPACKVLMNLRDPYDLLRSTYLFGLRRGLDMGPLEESLSMPIGQIMGSGFRDRNRRGQLTRTDQVTLLESVLVSHTIVHLRALFGPKQVFFIPFRQISEAPGDLARSLFGFLGVDPSYKPAMLFEVVNQALVPRGPGIGALGHWVADSLRKWRLLSLLGLLHRSRWIKKLFFRPPDAEFQSKAHQISGTLKNRLDSERRSIEDALNITMW